MKKRSSDLMGKAAYVMYNAAPGFETWFKMPGKLRRKE